MKTIVLDGGRLACREQAMDLLGAAFDCPCWWGRNLDALCDCLWELKEPAALEVENHSLTAASPFGRSLLRALAQCAAENPRFSLLLR